jgi:hypothetical protein
MYALFHPTMRVGHRKARDLEQMVKLIREQVERGLADGEARQLAVRIVSGRTERGRDRAGDVQEYIRGFGRNYLAPPGPVCRSRDEQCEIEKVWDFLVLNVRYVYDTLDRDVYATLKESLDAGGGDCDDGAIAFATLLGHLGFHVQARVISERANPEEPVHVYPLVGLPKDDPTAWVPLDMTVPGALPGWEYPDRAKIWDFDLVG